MPAAAERLNDFNRKRQTPSAPPTTSGEKPAFAVFLSDILGPTGEFRALQKKLKSACIDYVQRGHLRAFGYSAPRRPDDTPVEVPSDLWAHPIYWDKDKLSGNGLEIVAVRLIPTQWLLQAQGISPQSPSRRQGRPSRDSDILNAWNELVEEGKIDFSGTRANACRLVRERVLKLFPDQGDAGLGDKALYRKLKPLWDKATQ